MTIATLTGLVIPVSGLISTVPSILGYVKQVSGLDSGFAVQPHVALTRVAEIPGYPIKKFVFGRPETRTNALIFSRGSRD